MRKAVDLNSWYLNSTRYIPRPSQNLARFLKVQFVKVIIKIFDSDSIVMVKTDLSITDCGNEIITNAFYFIVIDVSLVDAVRLCNDGSLRVNSYDLKQRKTEISPFLGHV